MSCPQDVVRSSRWLCVALLMSGALLATGCAGPKTGPVWPTLDALPKQPPADLKTQAGGSVLRRGSDGFLYLVGGVGDRGKPGAQFMARYSGEWPFSKIARPALATGHVVRRYSDQVALVTLSYTLPDAKVEGLEVRWRESASEQISKGLAEVTRLKPDARHDLELSLGQEHGLRPGDIYAILSTKAPDKQANSQQLGRRLAGVCQVRQASDERALCKLWEGSALHPSTSAARVGDVAVFLEHTFGQPPRQGTFEFGRIAGDTGDKLRDHLVTQMNQYLLTHASANARAIGVDVVLDATDPAFHHADQKLKLSGMPQIAVGASLRKVDGEVHLILNYTTAGAVTGPGMVAAPPDGGVDLGEVSALSAETLRQAFGMLWGGMLVARGQTSEALMHLRQTLMAPTLQGPMRWHSRDQYAMRWAALGRTEEALWLVLEDEAVAAADKDREAVLNALGTRVRLYDMLDLHDEALAAATRFTTMRRAEHARRPNLPALLSALGMQAEMSLGARKLDEARKLLAEIEAACPDTCGGDLYAYLSGIYWAVPPTARVLQDELYKKLEALSQKHPERFMPSQRVYQGLHEMRERRFEGAMIAFLEAERLFLNQKNPTGEARAKFFAFMAQLAMKEPAKALQTAGELLALAERLRDYGTASRIYDNMVGVYSELRGAGANEALIRAAGDIAFKIYGAQMASGDLRKASETVFVLGRLLLEVGDLRSARTLFRRSVTLAVQSTRFEVAAVAHLMLATVARMTKNEEEFRAEVRMAQLMAKLSQDPKVEALIRKALEAPAKREDDVKTRLL